MRKPEQKLWDNLRDSLSGGWFARRIEDGLGSGLPDLWFCGRKRRGGWMELKSLSSIPPDKKKFDIDHFTPDQRAFGLSCLEYGGASSWWLMTRCGDIDHLHRATIIDKLNDCTYGHFRKSAVWVGRLSPDVAQPILDAILS